MPQIAEDKSSIVSQCDRRRNAESTACCPWKMDALCVFYPSRICRICKGELHYLLNIVLCINSYHLIKYWLSWPAAAWRNRWWIWIQIREHQFCYSVMFPGLYLFYKHFWCFEKRKGSPKYLKRERESFLEYQFFLSWPYRMLFLHEIWHGIRTFKHVHSGACAPLGAETPCSIWSLLSVFHQRLQQDGSRERLGFSPRLIFNSAHMLKKCRCNFTSLF